MKKRIRSCLEDLPLGLGPGFFIPVARLALSLTPKKLKMRLDLKEETIEAKRIIRTIESNRIEQTIIVYDNSVSPPTYGDYFMVVMLARYFVKRNIHLHFLIVDGEYRSDWGALDEEEKQGLVSVQVAIAELLLDSKMTNVEIVTYQELKSRIGNDNHVGWLIPFKERASNRIQIYGSSFNVLNHLMSVATPEFRNTFLLSFDELVGKVNFERPALPYITWHCRYSEKWGTERNTDDLEFVQIYQQLKSIYPDYAIMVVSDETGCSHFKVLAKAHRFKCLYSKDYSTSFLGDGTLILGSDYYYQFFGGGIALFAWFSNVPCETYTPRGNEREWKRGRIRSWSNENQIITYVPWEKSLRLPSGSIKLPQK